MLQAVEGSGSRRSERYLDSVREIGKSTWDELPPACGAEWTCPGTAVAVPRPGFDLVAIVAERDGEVLALVTFIRANYTLD